MKMARSTYYAKTKNNETKLTCDLELRTRIEEVLAEFPYYGYRRIRHHLVRQGVSINGKRIQRVMKKFALFSSPKRSFKQRRQSLDQRLVFPNLIRGLEITGPNQLWATDFTYVKLLKEYIYVSAIIDVYTRKIIGWSVSRDLSHKFCLDAIKAAVKDRQPSKSLIHHSDRGIQYTNSVYVSYLEAQGIQISMSRKATPQDNAFIESFFKTLKYDEIHLYNYETIEDVRKYLPNFIETVYNQKRLHSSIGYKPPTEFEAEILKLKPADRPVQKIWGKAV